MGIQLNLEMLKKIRIKGRCCTFDINGAGQQRLFIFHLSIAIK